MKIKNVVRLSFALFVTLGISVMVGCDNKSASNSNSTASGTPAAGGTPPATSGTSTSRTAKSGATGTISANPNPVKVCDGSAVGVTNVSWTFSGAHQVQVRVGSPDGGILAMAGAPGTQSTGKWVGNGSVFYLQDISKGLPPTADYTIATVTVNTTTQGCP